MDASFDVADPSDWLQSPIPKLAPVESALRCQVCKDFYDTPMITSCSHTFCSLCIRRCLTNDGKCPTCRTPDQELRLRQNWTVQEIVESFKLARPTLSQLAKDVQRDPISGARNRPKRKLEDIDSIREDEYSDVTRIRRTRLQSRQASETHNGIEDSVGKDMQDGELAACPICGKRMKEEAVFLHLDIHEVTNQQTQPARLPPKGAHRRSPSVELVKTSRTSHKPTDRLPKLNYSLLKENALRKKMSELGIPNTGSKGLLMRRHEEWVNIVNANADSATPKSKREMLRELDLWDRSTGRQIANNSSDSSNPGSVMRKDFDGAAWAASHHSEFEDLISKARLKSKDSSITKDSTSDATIPAEEEIPKTAMALPPPASDQGYNRSPAS